MVGNTNSEIKALELEVDSLYSKKKKKMLRLMSG
jgi:hypothetical protein